MKKLFTILFVALSSFLFHGCASSLMTKSQSEVISNSDSNVATVVFMRSSFIASAIGVELFEIVDGNLEFVGALPNGSKIAHKTSPGRKIYMAYGEAADFMIVNVEGNKTYYSIVRPNWGTGGFAPTPIRRDETSDYNMKSNDFKEWTSNTKLLEKKPAAKEWFAKNQKKYLDIYNKYWSKFETKTDAEKAQRTITPADGI